MKRFTLLLFSAVAGLTAMAQNTTGAHGETIDPHGVIIAAPADIERHVYKREGDFALFSNMIEDENGDYTYGIETYEDNMSSAFVECEDGTVFIQNILSQTDYNTWVVGKREGDVIRIKNKQPLWYDSSVDYTVHLIRNVFLLGEDMSFDLVENYDDIILKVSQAAGSERLTLEEWGTSVYSYSFIGGAYDDPASTIIAHLNGMPYLGDFNTVYSYDPNYDPDADTEKAIMLPDGMQLKTYTCHAYSYNQSAAHNYQATYIDFDVQIGKMGDYMFIQGLYYFSPEYVVKGKIEGNTVVFPQHQFLGRDARNVDIYACAVGYGYDEDGDETFVDAENWTLTYDSDDDVYDGGMCVVRFARNPYYAYGNSYESIDEIVISPKNTSGIQAVESTVAMPNFYDLNGRLARSGKGIFVGANGKKVIK